MVRRSLSARAVAFLLSVLILTATAPFSPAETFASSPLGSMISPGRVTVGNTIAPTGTTIFAGDRVVAEGTPAIVNFLSGSRVEMTKATASFTRQGRTLAVQANNGLLRFNFKKGESVKVNAGRYTFSAVGNGTAHVGELALNHNGQIAMSLSQGIFAVVHLASGARSEVTPANPLIVLDQTGQGNLTRGGKNLTDPSKSWQPNEHKGKCVEAGGETHEITGNSANALTLKDGWRLTTGSYDYAIIDCPAGGPVAAPGPSVPATAGAAGRKMWPFVLGGAGAAVGVAFAVHEALEEEKSPANR